jgi:ankyrin repeat protein
VRKVNRVTVQIALTQCRACFEGDEQALARVLADHSVESLCQHDKHGLTPLHIAAMRDSVGCVKMLLKAGLSVKVKSQPGGWLPFEEGLCYSSVAALKVLYDEHKQLLEAQLKDRVAQLKKVFAGMPDCAFQVRALARAAAAAACAAQMCRRSCDMQCSNVN